MNRRGPGVVFCNHVVIPMATLGAVYALLSFLVDLRSVFMDTTGLKWIGFWFVFATVLLGRYGKMYGREERQGFYTFSLAVATFMAMNFSPWRGSNEGLPSILVNGFIVYCVWRFTTHLTENLSMEDPPYNDHVKRYGTERIEHEKHIPAKPRPKKSRDPIPSVWKLGLGGMLVFAMAEPVLLEGPPDVLTDSMTAMILFLFSIGVVMAAAASMHTLHRVERSEGQISMNMVPIRVGLSALGMFLILTVTLALSPPPRSQYHGRTTEQTGQGDVSGDGREEGEKASGDGTENEGGEGSQGEKAGKGNAKKMPSSPPPLLSELGALSKWLLIPFILAVLAIAVYVCFKLFREYKRRTSSDLWQRLLARLGKWIRTRKLFKRAEPKPVRQDPFANLRELTFLAPREAVFVAYQRMLVFCDGLGYTRQERQTPAEFMHGLPKALKHLDSSVRSLTTLYVKAAYSPESVEPDDREAVLFSLRALKTLSDFSPNEALSETDG